MQQKRALSPNGLREVETLTLVYGTVRRPRAQSSVSATATAALLLYPTNLQPLYLRFPGDFLIREESGLDSPDGGTVKFWYPRAGSGRC
nr:unnamed protein product [Callosobruchus analis]